MHVCMHASKRAEVIGKNEKEKGMSQYDPTDPTDPTDLTDFLTD